MVSALASRFMQTLQQIERAGEVEPLVALFSDAAELQNLAMLKPVRGLEAVREFWKNYLAIFDQIHSEFTQVTENDRTIVLEWVSAGSLATGEPLHYRGVSVLELEAEQVIRFRTYYDSAVFLPSGAKV